MQHELIGIGIGSNVGMHLAKLAAEAKFTKLSQRKRRPVQHLRWWISITFLGLTLGAAGGWLTRDAAAFADREHLAAGLFAVASVLGTMGGFAAAAAVFLGGAAGPGIERVRRQLGIELPIALGAAVVTLFLGALLVAICGIYSNGWLARGLTAGAVTLGAVQTFYVTIAVTSASAHTFASRQ